MGVNVYLSGPGGKFHFSKLGWYRMLDLACEYDWEPAGTEPTPYYDAIMELWDELRIFDAVPDDSYYTEEFNLVTDEDAANIADALERALDDIPDFNTAEKLAHYSNLLDDLRTEEEHGICRFNDSLSSVDFFSGKDKQVVRAFIEYCRAGGFGIE